MYGDMIDKLAMQTSCTPRGTGQDDIYGRNTTLYYINLKSQKNTQAFMYTPSSSHLTKNLY